ncbi:hypothetical protein ACFQ4C_12170 [Larkinella insperata]|uniref:Outer membrane protein beta-barrel domain-containing protein n=1 Tax=Larkinella insperata TaxID=332158 RepID=A0ABW3QAN8_9BACT|nr:hypothetical protein [Larkinella insperata]
MMGNIEACVSKLITMKATLFTLFIFFFIAKSQAQEAATLIGQTFEFSTNLLLDKCDIDGKTTKDAPKVLVKKHWKFTVANELTDGKKTIYLNQFNDTETNKNYFSQNDGSLTPTIFFLISPNVFTSSTRKPEGRWAFGTVIMPLKLRFGDTDSKGNNLRSFDFTSEVNIGLSLAYKITPRTWPTKIFVIGSIGTTSIPVEAATTKDFIESKTNVAAFSPTLGFLVNFDDIDLQLNLVTGIDYMPGELGRKWIYRNQPFLGLGIGFSIFNFGNKGKNDK